MANARLVYSNCSAIHVGTQGRDVVPGIARWHIESRIATRLGVKSPDSHSAFYGRIGTRMNWEKALQRFITHLSKWDEANPSNYYSYYLNGITQEHTSALANLLRMSVSVEEFSPSREEKEKEILLYKANLLTKAITRLAELDKEAENYGEYRMAQIMEEDIALFREALTGVQAGE